MPDQDSIKTSTLIKYFLLSFIVLFSVTFSILFFTDQQIKKIKLEETKSKETHIIQLEYDYLSKDLEIVLSDLYFLKNAYIQELQNPTNYENIADDWAEFSTQRKIYDQIRFIDLNGNEIIRINYTDQGGLIVPQNELQNKKDRYYFSESITLNKYGIFISPLDLNVEHGEIEMPHKPIVRIAIPVFTDTGEVFGIIILNYLAQDMLNTFQEIAQNNLGDIALVNSDGYWLSSKDSSLAFNFMFPDLEMNTFQNQYGDNWTKIINREDTQFVSPEGLFTSIHYNTVQQLSTNSEHLRTLFNSKINVDWYIISIIPRDQVNKLLFIDKPTDTFLHLVQTNWLYVVLIIIISCFVAGFIYVNRRSFNVIKYYSEYDGLTNVFNRRAGMAKIQKIISAKDQKQQHASLCFLDINGLKTINDVLGHKTGDDLIITTIQIIKSAIRGNDFIIRMGGDEFLIALNNATETQAEEVWGRITHLINDFNKTKQKSYIISVSHGVIHISSTEKIQLDEAIKLADEKMYKEKQKIKETLDVIVHTSIN